MATLPKRGLKERRIGRGARRPTVRRPPGSLEVVDNLAGSRPLVWRYHEVDVPTAEAVERMVRHTPRVNPHRAELVAPSDRSPLILKRADRFPALEPRVSDRNAFLLGDATLEEARALHASSVR